MEVMGERGEVMRFNNDFLETIRQTEKVSKTIAEENAKKKQREIELTNASKETAMVITEFKDLVKEFINASEAQTKSTNRLNTMLFWFTLVSVLATAISATIAVMQFYITSIH